MEQTADIALHDAAAVDEYITSPTKGILNYEYPIIIRVRTRTGEQLYDTLSIL